jgi:anti-sigma factor RsiW
MAEPIGEHNIGEYLTAFADCELDAAGIMSVLEYLAAHPEALELMREQQRLRLLASHAVKEQTPAPPPQVRERVRELLDGGATYAGAVAAPAPAGARRGRGRVARWRFAAAAVVALGIGVLAGRLLPRGGPGVVESAPPPVPASLIAAATGEHVDCSRHLDALHAGPIPAELGDLPDRLRRDLNRDAPHPDLSPIGYEYVGASPCRKPFAGWAHLFYRARGGGVTDGLSVFVQPHAGSHGLEASKLYTVAGADSPHPMLVWRTERVVYLLVGDDLPTVQNASRLIAPAAGARGGV